MQGSFDSALTSLRELNAALRRTGLGGAALRLPRSAKDDNDFAWRRRPPP